MKTLIATIALLLSTTAFADTCFDSEMVRNWDYKQETGVLTVNTMRGNFDLQLSYCSELPWAHTIAFKSFFASDVCSYDSVLVLDGFNHVVQQCKILSVTKK